VNHFLNMLSFEFIRPTAGELADDVRLRLLNHFSFLALLVLFPFAVHHFFVGEPAWGTASAVAVLLCLGNLLAAASERKPLLPVWAQYGLILCALLVGLNRFPEAAVFWCYVIPVTYRGACSQKVARRLDTVYLITLISGGFAWLSFEVAIRFAVTFCLLCVLLDLLFDAILSQFEQLREQALADPLTGVGNRRRMQQLLTELDNADATAQQTCLITLDVDDLKDMNDQLGHQAGDALLKRVAECLQRNLPENAVLCRTGGDEFSVLLPQTSNQAGQSVAEKLRQSIATDSLLHEYSLTISLGLAARLSGESIAKWQRRADEQLYGAKRQGGNVTCVAVADSPVTVMRDLPATDVVE